MERSPPHAEVASEAASAFSRMARHSDEAWWAITGRRLARPRCLRHSWGALGGWINENLYVWMLMTRVVHESVQGVHPTCTLRARIWAIRLSGSGFGRPDPPDRSGPQTSAPPLMPDPWAPFSGETPADVSSVGPGATSLQRHRRGRYSPPRHTRTPACQPAHPPARSLGVAGGSDRGYFWELGAEGSVSGFQRRLRALGASGGDDIRGGARARARALARRVGGPVRATRTDTRAPRGRIVGGHPFQFAAERESERFYTGHGLFVQRLVIGPL